MSFKYSFYELHYCIPLYIPGDQKRVQRALPRQERVRGIRAPARRGQEGEQEPLHRDQGHHGPGKKQLVPGASFRFVGKS